VLPSIELIDTSVDTTNHLLVIGYGLDSDTTFDGVPLPPGQIFVAKLDPEGNVVWLRSFADAREIRAVAVGPEDRALVLSTTRKYFGDCGGIPPTNYERFYLTAFSTDGELLWEQSIGGDFEKKIALDTGSAELAVDFQGNAIVAASFRGNLETPLGTFQTADPWDFDVAFVQIDPNGSIVQAKHFDAPAYQYVGDVAIDTAGDIVAAASLGGPEVIVKLDGTFSLVWARGFSGTGFLNFTRVAIGANDDVFMAGVFQGTVDFGTGLVHAQTLDSPFLVRLDSAGNVKSSKTYPATEAGFPVALAAKSSGDVAFSTQFSPTIDLGGGTIAIEDVQHDSALALYGAGETYMSGARVGGVGSQGPVAIAFSPQGHLYWAVSYAWGLKYGDQVLVEVPPDDVFPHGSGSAVIALPQYIAKFSPAP
jgi:hypothetical protein